MSSMTLSELAELLQSMSSQELVQLLMEFAEQYPGARFFCQKVVFLALRPTSVEVCATRLGVRWSLPTTQLAQFCTNRAIFCISMP